MKINEPEKDETERSIAKDSCKGLTPVTERTEVMSTDRNSWEVDNPDLLGVVEEMSETSDAACGGGGGVIGGGGGGEESPKIIDGSEKKPKSRKTSVISGDDESPKITDGNEKKPKSRRASVVSGGEESPKITDGSEKKPKSRRTSVVSVSSIKEHMEIDESNENEESAREKKDSIKSEDGKRKKKPSWKKIDLNTVKTRDLTDISEKTETKMKKPTKEPCPLIKQMQGESLFLFVYLLSRDSI